MSSSLPGPTATATPPRNRRRAGAVRLEEEVRPGPRRASLPHQPIPAVAGDKIDGVRKEKERLTAAKELIFYLPAVNLQDSHPSHSSKVKVCWEEKAVAGTGIPFLWDLAFLLPDITHKWFLKKCPGVRSRGHLSFRCLGLSSRALMSVDLQVHDERPRVIPREGLVLRS